mgnify:CR=1 FL=1
MHRRIDAQMKTIATAIVFTLITAIWALSVEAQVTPQASSTSAPAKPDPVQEAKLQALQAEVQVFKDFTQHILTTIYFSLGTVVVVLFAMVGFGWYQNVRVYERDKEAMRQALLNALNEQVSVKVSELDKKATERFLAFDNKMATALKHSLQRLNDLHLALETSIFRATHTEKTPETDFMVLLQQVHQAIGTVSPGVLDHALSVMLDYVETAPYIAPPTRTSLLTLANQLPAGTTAYSERIREVLAKKAV